MIKRYSERESLYNFVRDLHVANIDQGLGRVNSRIEQEIRAIGGEKLLKLVGTAKKVFPLIG